MSCPCLTREWSGTSPCFCRSYSPLTVHTHCPDMFLPEGCFSHVGAFGKTFVQQFCETSENCQRALADAKTRRGAWLALHKQGQDMIKSSNKRVKLLDFGSNVRIPILSVDRAPSGPTSLVDVVPDVSSTGNTFRLGTQHGQIPTWFSHSDVTLCGGNLLISASAAPDVELSVRTTARQKVGPSRTNCNCKTSCASIRCGCYKQRSRKSCITGRGT